MGFASRDKKKLKDAVVLDADSIELIKHSLPAVDLTTEQINQIASLISVPSKLSDLNDDSTHRLTTDAEKGVWNGKQNALSGTPVYDDDARLSDARTPKTHTHPNDHAAGSDNQDLSGLQPKETGKGLSTNDYTTAEQTKLAGLSNYTHPANHSPSIITQDASNRFVTDTEKTTWSGKQNAAAFNSVYRTLLDSTGSHIAAKGAGTYGVPQGNPLAVSGTGTLYALNTIYIDSNDYPTIDGKAAKLRIRCNIACNDVAPFTGTFTVGLHPVTRPATSGGAGLCIYTIGAAVSGSTCVGTNLAADSQNNLVGADFALPANGFYVIAVVTSASMATSSHVHISASLQIRNA